jgi:hypothetical protein
MVNQDPWAAYGAMQVQHLERAEAATPDYIVKPPLPGRQRMKMNIVAIFVSLFFPWILFCLLYADTSFRLHYKMPQLCWFFVGLGAFLVLIIGGFCVQNISQMINGQQTYQPTWFIFLFLTSLVAVCAGPLLGNANFWENMQPYYDLQNLNDYSGVDPTRMRGQQMMDAGRVQFVTGAKVDLAKAYAFQNLDTYCVAPITVYNPGLGTTTPLTSYDFWAVGLNCCGGTSTKDVNFTCGSYSDKDANQGLRLMHDEQRTFMRLAVQQAEAAHMITANHPLFFHWTNDAPTEMHGYLAKAYANFACWMCATFACQLFLVFVVSYFLSKAGYSKL